MEGNVFIPGRRLTGVFQGYSQHKKYLQQKKQAIFIQSVIRRNVVFVAAREKSENYKFYILLTF
jgi:hypothetical protein